MSQFPIHTKSTAPAASVAILNKAEKKFGWIPNLIGGLAEAPIAAEAYLTLSRLVGQSSFTPEERHVVWFTLNEYHNCEYCMSAHTAMANSENIAPSIVESARQGEPYADTRLESLRNFTRLLAENRGWADEKQISSFLSAGFSRQNVLEIITFIAHKVISNYSNHIVNTPLDEPFKSYAWSKPELEPVS